MRSDPADVSVQVDVADEAEAVEQRVRDDERQYAPGALEPPPEDEAHDHVSGEATPALVEVVGAAQQGAGAERSRVGPAELAQPGEQVAHHDDLLEDAVLRRLEQKQ